MRFNYTYRITYGSGQCCDRSRQQLTIEITREQYGRIIEKVIQGCTISEVPGIEKLLKDMEEQVRFVDRWDNLDGSYVILSTEQGRVKLEDSRKNGMAMLMDTDKFLNLVVRW